MELAAPCLKWTQNKHKHQQCTVKIGNCGRDLDCICILAKELTRIKSVVVSLDGMMIIKLSGAFSQLPDHDGYVDVLGGFLRGASLPVASMHKQLLEVHLTAQARDGTTEEQEEGPAVYVKWSDTQRDDVDGATTEMQFWQPARGGDCNSGDSLAARLAAERTAWTHDLAYWPVLHKTVLKPPAVVCGQLCYSNLLRTRDGVGAVCWLWD